MKEKLIKLSKSFQNFILKYNYLIEKEINIVSNKLEIDLDTLKLDSIHHKMEEIKTLPEKWFANFQTVFVSSLKYF